VPPSVAQADYRRCAPGAPLSGVAGDGLAAPRRHWALAGLWAGMAMSVLDGVMINLALPAIARDQGTSAASATWVVSAYQIAIVMALLPLAALGERIGYHRVYLGGLVLFVLASVFCALCGDLASLTAWRFAQGAGAAAMMAVNGAQMRLVWPKALLRRGIAHNGLLIAGAAAAGPALAGMILSLGDWPWLFLVNLPLGLVALLLVIGFAPALPPVTRLFDALSATLSAALFGALFVAASDLAHGDPSWVTGLAAALSGVAAVLLARRARSTSRPLIPLDLLRIAGLGRAYGASICAFAAQMCALVSLPFLLLQQRGGEAAGVAMLILPFPIGVALASIVAGRMAERGWSPSGSLGLGLSAVAFMAVVPALAVSASPSLLMLVIGLSGLGFGAFQVVSNHRMLTAAPIDRAGAAAGMLSLCRLLGQTAGGLSAALVLRLGAAQGPMSLVIAAALGLAAACLARRS
jgi:DHA2 family multidrug resistance protein-like MFS transporter